MIARKVGVLLETECRGIPEDGFVEDLQKVDPNQDCKYDFIGLSTDAFVLKSSE